MSSTLQINEILAGAFVQEAQRRLTGYEDDEQMNMKLAFQLYFEERRALLTALLDLVKGRIDDSNHEIQEVVLKFTDELLVPAAGFSAKLVDLIVSRNAILNSTMENLPAEAEDYLLHERLTIALILFYIHYLGFRNPDSVSKMVNVLGDLANLARSKDPSEPVFQIALLILFALMSALDPNIPDIIANPNGPGPSSAAGALGGEDPPPLNSLVKNTQFITAFESAIEKCNWEAHTRGIQAVLKLAFSLFLSAAGKSSTQHWEWAVKRGDVFAFIRTKILTSKLLQETSQNQAFFQSKLDEIITCLLVSESSKVLELKHADERDAQIEYKAQYDRMTGRTLASPRYDFEQLLFLIAALFESAPDASLKFWESRDLVKFVTFAGEKPSLRLYVAYLDMLAALANSPHSAERAWEFLRHPRNPNVGWKHFFSVIDKYNMELQADAGMVGGVPGRPREIRPEDIDGLCAMLRLISVVLIQYPASRDLMHNDDHWRSLYSLFGLLGCSVPFRLKAHILRVISGFARSPPLCANIWRLLEESEMFPIPPNANPNAFLSTLEGRPAAAAAASTALLPVYARRGAEEVTSAGGEHGGEGMMVGGERVRTLFYGGPPLQGIVYDLEEVEAREEVYEETRAFLLLLFNLIRSGIPHGLGHGFRIPGFLPYFNYVAGHVWLKFDTRGYSVSGEKWDVGKGVLLIFDRVLSEYAPDPAEFVVPEVPPAAPRSTSSAGGLDLSGRAPMMMQSGLGGVGPSHGGVGSGAVEMVAARTPGFALMCALLTGGPLFRKLLWVLDHGVGALKSDRFKSGGASFEACVLLGLKVLHRAFELEPEFLGYLRSAPLSPAVTSLDRLLQQSKSLLLKLTDYISYPHSTELSYYAIKVVHWLSSRAIPLVPVYSSLHAVDDLSAKFVALLEDGTPEILESEVPMAPLSSLLLTDPGLLLAPPSLGGNVSAGAYGSFAEVPQVTVESVSDFFINRSREAILDLMLASMDVSYPSMTHMLAGFDVTRGLENSVLSGLARTCLTVSLELLADPNFVVYFPTLAERCAHLVYELAAAPATSTATLQLLRSRNVDYFEQSYGMLSTETRVPLGLPDIPSGPLLRLRYISWVLHSISLELHLTGSEGSHHRSHASRLLSALYSTPDAITGTTTTTGGGGGGISLWESSMALAREGGGNVEQARMKLLELLYALDPSEGGSPESGGNENPFPSIPLDDAVVSSTIRVNAEGVEAFDIPALYAALQEAFHVSGGGMELRGMDTGEGQDGRNPVAHAGRVREILESAIKYNAYHETVVAKVALMEGWEQVVSVTLSECYELLGSETREAVLFEILDSLLLLLARGSFGRALARPLSSVVLGIMSKLLHVAVSTHQTSQVPVDHLHTILHRLLAAIMSHETGPLQRGNLYAALMAYLQLTQPSSTLPSKHLGSLSGSVGMDVGGGGSGGLLGAEALASRRSVIADGNRKILSAAGDQVLDLLCRDATQGAPVQQALAFAALNVLVAATSADALLEFSVSRGYMRVFLDDLGKNDGLLSSVLTSSSGGSGLSLGSVSSLRALHVYEAKMSLLLRLAGSHQGARMLVESGLIHTLTSCHFIDTRPEPSVVDSLPPVVVETYHALLMPVLQVLVSLLTSLGSGAVEQVVSFLAAHSELVLLVLKDRSPTLTAQSLSEVGVMVSLFCSLAKVSKGTMDALFPDLGWQFHSQMLNLLAKYCVRARWDPVVSPNLDRGVAQKKAWFILRNLMGYTTLLTHPGGSEGLLFAPSLVGALSSSLGSGGDIPLAIHTRARPPPLTVLVRFAASCTSDLFSAFKEVDLPLRKLDSLAQLDLIELHELAGVAGSASDVPLDLLQFLAERALVEQVRSKQKDITTLWYLLESSLLVLLRHLQWFFTVYIPSDSSSSSSVGGESENPLAPSSSDLAQLSLDVTASVTPVLDSLLKLEAAEAEFVQFLVRRMREIIRMGADLHGSALGQEPVFSARRRQQQQAFV